MTALSSNHLGFPEGEAKPVAMVQYTISQKQGVWGMQPPEAMGYLIFLKSQGIQDRSIFRKIYKIFNLIGV